MRAVVVAALVAGCAGEPEPEFGGFYRATDYALDEDGCEVVPVTASHAYFDLLEDWRGDWEFRWCDDGDRCAVPAAYAFMRLDANELSVVDPYATHGDDIVNQRITCIQGYWQQRAAHVAATEVQYRLEQHVLEREWADDCTEDTALATVGDGNCVRLEIVTGTLTDRASVVGP